MKTQLSTVMKNSLTVIPEPRFANHIDAIRHCKKLTDEAMELWNPGHHVAGEAMAVAWESIFAFFCEERSKSLDLESLLAISSILQKLTSSHKALRHLEIKVREHLIREEEFQQKRECLRAALESSSAKQDGLTESTLRKIEEQLKLL